MFRKDQIVLCRHQKFRSLVLTDRLARYFQIAFRIDYECFHEIAVSRVGVSHQKTNMDFLRGFAHR